MIKLFEAGKQSRANISSLSKDVNLTEGYIQYYQRVSDWVKVRI
jgi:hypothetical protein